MVIPETDYGLETMLHMKRTSPDTSTTELSFDWAISTSYAQRRLDPTRPWTCKDCHGSKRSKHD